MRFLLNKVGVVKTVPRLVCLDFDGTIMVYDEAGGHFHVGVIDLLNRLADAGIAWCTNSGRDQYDQLEVLKRCRAKGLTAMPVALMCSESVIYERVDTGYVSFEPWNTRVQDDLRRLHREVQSLLDPRMESIVSRYGSCPYYIGENYTAFNVLADPDLPMALHRELEDLLKPVQGCVVTRNGGWVAIITEQAGKGNVLREYMTRRGFAPNEVLAVGDQYNDLSMLDGSAAALVGCPGDAIVDVVDVVRNAGGIVAESPGPEGTLEVIRAYVKRV